MLIEFVGVSGAGKSTLLKAVRSELRRKGWKCREFFRFCGNANLQHEDNWKKTHSESDKIEMHRLLSLWEFCSAHPELARLFFEASQFTRRQLWDCASTLVSLVQLEQLQHDHLMVIADEGLLHRCIAAFSAQGNDAEFARFLRHAIFPDALIHVDVSGQVANGRALERVPLHRRGAVGRNRPSAELLARQSEMLRQTCIAARQSEAFVLSVDGSRPLSDNAAEIAQALDYRFSAQGSAGGLMRA